MNNESRNRGGKVRAMNGSRWIVAAVAAVVLSSNTLAVTPTAVRSRTVESARTFRGPYSMVAVAGDRPVVVRGSLWNQATGEVAAQGAELGDGAWLNVSEAGAGFLLVGDDLVPLDTMETVGVQSVGEQEAGVAMASNFKTCYVECDVGFYACCRYGSPPKCKCWPNDTNHECDAGGPGAGYCSIAQGKLQDVGAEVPE